MKKRILSIILVMTLMLTLTPMSVFAVNVPEITIDSTTSTQDNATWAWDAGTSTLTLKGINMSLSSDSGNYGIEITGTGDNALTTVNVLVIGENVISGNTGIVYRGSSATTSTINFSGTGSLTVSSGEIHSMSLWRTTVNFNSGLYNLSSSSTSNNNNFIISAMQTTCNFNGATVNMTAAPFGSGYVDGYYSGGVDGVNSNVYINSGSVTINTRGTNITTSKVVINGGTSDFHIGTSTLNNINDYGKTTINGGQVKLTGGLGAEQFQNNALDTLALTTLTLDGISAATAVSSLTTTSVLSDPYGTTDMKTDANGKIYAYLPTGKTAATVVAGDNAYTGSITSNAGTLTLVSSLTDISLAPVPITYVKRATAGTKVAALTATGTPTSGITYSLAGSGANDSLFQIVGTQLQIKSGASLTAQSYTVKVKVTDGTPTNTYTKLITFTANVLPETYVVSPANNFTNASGVIATATFLGTPYGAGYAVGSTATITITLSGTATATGTYTIGLTSAKAGIITAPTTVTKTVTAGATPTDVFLFTFTMPAYAVDDVAVTNTFAPASEIPVTSITGAPTAGVAGTEINLNSATVSPSDATNKTIAWSVKNAGTTGITTSDLATGKFTPGTAGTLVLTATIVNGATASTNYTQDVTITVSSAGTKIYTISADTALINFGSLTTGYGSAPASQTVTITNTGNQTITLTEPATTNASSNYNIGTLSNTILDAGDTATFTIQPKTGLVVGSYNETIQIAGTESAATSVSVQFSVTSAGGSGSGGGGSNITKATPVINTNTGSVTGNQLKNAADAAKDGETVTIKSNETDEVTLPTSGLDSLSDRNNSLTVVTEKGTLIFNSKAVDAMGTQATDDDIKVIVDDVVKTALTEAQQTEVGDKTVYDLTVMSGGKLISNFNGGKVTVSIPYDLKSGETAEDLKVWYMADNGSLTEINCTYDTKNKVVTFVVEHFSKYIIGYDEVTGWVNPFTDLKSSAWYYDAAVFVNTNGLMKGQTETTFGPQTAMTRGMFVTILGRMEGIDATVYASKNTFSDVKSNEYYAPYIAWATEKGIVSGMGGEKFAPNSAVTREQMAVMMTNYMKAIGEGPTGEWAIQLTYSDLDQVSSWADEAVMFMTMKGLMNGTGNDAAGNPLFAPKSTSTRAQTAQVMMSLGELLN